MFFIEIWCVQIYIKNCYYILLMISKIIPENGGEAGSEAKSVKEYSVWNHDSLPCEEVPFYKPPAIYERWYFMVFKPFDSNYDPKYNALDFIRKGYTKDAGAFVITKEQNATKVHWNALIYSRHKLMDYHKKKTQRFMIYSEITLEPLSVYRYMTKEYYLLGYNWKLYSEFIYYIKNYKYININGYPEDSDDEEETSLSETSSKEPDSSKESKARK